MLIKSELYKMLKSKKSIFFIVLMILIPFIDLLSNTLNVYRDYWLNKEEYVHGIVSSMKLNPAMGSFLSGSSHGHISQMLLIWIMPIYLMIIYSDTYISEVKYGYNNIVFTKSDRRKIVRQRFVISFALGFAVSFVGLFLNYIISNIVFYGGTDMHGLEYAEYESGFIALCLGNPNIAYLFYVIVYCLIAGGCGIICTGISFVIPNYKIAYPLVFFIWIVQIIAPFSLTYAMQPFIEYDLNYIIPSVLIYAFIVAAVGVVSYNFKVRCDEI